MLLIRKVMCRRAGHAPGLRRSHRRRAAVTATMGMLLLAPVPAGAQQFNSDNYLAMPHGTVTSLLTVGTEYSALLLSAALVRDWEFFAGAFLTWDDPETGASSKFSTTLYAKYMFYENKAKNGGFAVAAGMGSYPGYYEDGVIADPATTFWAIPQLSIPLFAGSLLWDLNPGVTLNTDYGDDKTTEVGFTYSTRAALYGLIPKSAIVGEVYGAEGGAYTPIQYRIGVRWEPSKYFVAAMTWSEAFDGEPSGGFEVGILAFSPRFACFGGCGPDD
ncbi:MAG: hypothetical protein ACWGON_08335 [Gemmatimonadota bacterium]